MSQPPYIFGTTRAGDGDWHISGLSEARISQLIETRHGTRPRAAAWTEQIHSTGHYFANSNTHGLLGRGDALLTDQADVALTMRTADCVPVFLLAEAAVGLLHAGMAGTVQGILPQVAHEFTSKYGQEAKTVRVHLGPHICARCYRMSENNLRFLRGFPAADRFIQHRANDQFFSLADMLADQAERIGLGEITRDEGCTHHDADYFSSSHGHEHRLLSYVMRHA